MARKRVKETIKDIDDISHVVTGHRIPYWLKRAWERLGPQGYQGETPEAPAADDPYAALGIDRNARPADIVSAYRELARKHHPDKGGKAKDFARIQDAYERIKKERNIR